MPHWFLLLCLIGMSSSTRVAAQEWSRWADELPHPRASTAVAPDAARDTPRQAPAPPLSRPPAAVRALYVNAWAFGSSRFYDLVRLADTTEVNALVIDVKDDTGYLTYPSKVATAIAIGANGEPRARDVSARLRLLAERGIHPIARIVVAKDPLLARGKPGWAIQSSEGGLWVDRQGRPWVDAFNDSVWTYAAELAAEAVRLGFAEVQYDYVRFPDESRARMATAVYPARREGESQREGVRRNLAVVGERTRALGVPFTIDVFGLTTSTEGDLGIGQHWHDLVTVADVVLPMVYPSHYYRGFYDITKPNFEPYRVVKRALEDGIRRTREAGGSAEIRPYLQAFTLGPPRYEPTHVREQIRAAEELGIMSWVLWNPRSAYQAGIFRPQETAEPPAGSASPAGRR
ncbi:MAG TPA: putative glycoside hydrolase [Gemmatimonadales bacterium]|nr:putative glycoside hydrolase [Gemmatimonadales bacterium]